MHFQWTCFRFFNCRKNCMLHGSFAKRNFWYSKISAVTLCTLLFLPDYPYCLTGKELRSIIKGLIGRCSDILPDFFDHCISSMLRELDRQSGRCKQLHKLFKVVWISQSLLFCCHHFHSSSLHCCLERWVKCFRWKDEQILSFGSSCLSCPTPFCSPSSISVTWRGIQVI